MPESLSRLVCKSPCKPIHGPGDSFRHAQGIHVGKERLPAKVCRCNQTLLREDGLLKAIGSMTSGQITVSKSLADQDYQLFSQSNAVKVKCLARKRLHNAVQLTEVFVHTPKDAPREIWSRPWARLNRSSGSGLGDKP